MERISRNLQFLLVCLIVSTASLECFTQEASADCQAAITVQVTAGNPDVVSGTVTGVSPADVWVVVFVQTDKWYIQPYADQRAYLPVNPDGTYQTWIREWKQISAFVIRKGYDALFAQQVYMPFPLRLDWVDVLGIAGHPTIQFSGYEWAVKGGISLGPGPNHFSTSHDNVWVDDQGRLHLKITQRDGKWYCAEVSMLKPLGYGTYIFQILSRVDLLAKNVVASPFIYLDDTHEMDVEFSRWGIENGPNAQFVVQPYYNPGNREQFTMTLLNDYSTHIIIWGSDAVSFKSAQGHYSNPPAEQIVHEWTYTGADLPAESYELVHINLWLLDGLPPSDGKEAEMVVQSFNFYFRQCTPPLSGNWMVDESCTLVNSAHVRGTVYVGYEAVLTIGQDGMLYIE